MATDRLYIVDTETNEYLCLAKGYHTTGWGVGNIDLYQSFMSTRLIDDLLVIGTESDHVFYDKHIKNGINFNTENKWEYTK